MEEKKKKIPHECTIWSHMARSHTPRLPGLQRDEYQGVQGAWQGRDRDEGKAGSWKPDGDGAPRWCITWWWWEWEVGGWTSFNLPITVGRETWAKGISERGEARTIWTLSTALISWFICRNILRVHTYIINVRLSRYLSIHMQKEGIKAHNTHNCYGGRMSKCT